MFLCGPGFYRTNKATQQQCIKYDDGEYQPDLGQALCTASCASGGYRKKESYKWWCVVTTHHLLQGLQNRRRTVRRQIFLHCS